MKTNSQTVAQFPNFKNDTKLVQLALDKEKAAKCEADKTERGLVSNSKCPAHQASAS